MRLVAFLILSVFTLALFVMTLFSSLRDEPLLFPIILAVTVLLVHSFYSEFRNILKSQKKPNLSKGFQLFLATIVGAIASYLLNVYLGLGAVVAAAAVGMTGASLISEYSIPLYCGSFVGMVSPVVLHDFGHVFIASIIAGILFVLSETVYESVGGKLGTIAFSSWVILSYLSKVELIKGEKFSWETSVETFVFSIIGVLLTYLLSVRLKKNTVASSSAISLFAGLVFPVLYPESGTMMASAMMCASFVGMSSKKVIKNELGALLSGIIMGVVFFYSVEHFGGAGGKLGTIAFGSALSIRSMHILLEKSSNRLHIISRN
ncbi:hypothetical protein [Kosmotoga pacifica]|uniref:Uncharacterized protein n=1 Tax=Kosmotoga pacifica TaxID=1330330 RepID=A0A0G2ZC84_9BACT|nr:hypothetical protein [Kosmotoga pacifica]AKI97701.1 hypothetical protein IX53_07595 [Kosmotoga pacifica]